MPNNYLFLDADSSVLTAHSSITSGVAHEPYVIISSILSMPASATSSVSGTVGSSIIGQLPAGTAVLGSVLTLQGTNPWNISSVYGNISGSVLSQQLGTHISSVVSSTPSSMLTGASIFGQLPAGTAVLGSVATLQGTNPWVVSGSVMLANGANVIGSVTALQGTNPWIIAPASVSGTVGASIVGQLPAGVAVLGSVATLQGTNPWVVSGSVMLLNSAATLGSVVAYQGVPSWNVAGSVLSQQMGTNVSSVVSSNPSSMLVGNYGQRNDAVASALGGDLSWRPIATDSAGRVTTKPFAAEESRIEGYISLTSTSVTTLVAAPGAGLRNYITDIWLANTGATTTLVTFSSGGGASVLGYTIVPTGSGSNLPGLVTPIRTGVNETFGIQAGSNTSILYATVKGFKAP